MSDWELVEEKVDTPSSDWEVVTATPKADSKRTWQEMLNNAIGTAPDTLIGALPEFLQPAGKTVIPAVAAGYENIFRTPYNIGAEVFGGKPLESFNFQQQIPSDASSQMYGTAIEYLTPGIAAGLLGKAAKVGKGLKYLQKEQEGMPYLKEKLGQTEKDLEMAGQEVSEAGKAAYMDTGKSKLDAMLRDIQEKGKQIQAFEPEATLPKENLENLLPGGTGEGLIPTAEKNIEQTASEISTLLNKGATHDVEVAKDINERIRALKKEGAENYNQINRDLEDKYVVIPRSKNLTAIEEEIKKITKRPYWDTPEFQQLKENLKIQLDAEGKKDIIPAKNMLDTWRRTRDAANEARLKGYKEGAGASDQQFWQNEYKELQKLADDQFKLLKDNMPPAIMENLEKANNFWRTKIAPLYKNKVYNQIKHEGRINTADIMKELRGTGAGQDILRNLITENEEILKNVLGQKFAEKPEQLLNPNQHQQSFIDHSPELQELVKKLKAALRGREYAQEKTKVLSTEAERVKNAFKEMADRQLKREAAIEKTEKLKEEIKKLNEHEKVLKEKLKQKEQTAKAKKEIEDKIKEIEDKRAKLFKILKGLGVGAGIVFGKSAFDLLKDALSGAQ